MIQLFLHFIILYILNIEISTFFMDYVALFFMQEPLAQFDYNRKSKSICDE